MTQIRKKATSSGSPSTCKSKIEHVERTNNHAATRQRKGNKNILKLTLVSHAVCGFRVSEARLTSFFRAACAVERPKNTSDDNLTELLTIYDAKKDSSEIKGRAFIYVIYSPAGGQQLQ